MASRVERHEQDQLVEKRRIQKNQTLYQDMKNYGAYQEVQNMEPVIEKQNFSLEDIHKEPERKRRNVNQESIATETLSSLLMMQEKKEYDINKVLKEAKETRGEKDSLEEKRNLKKKEYNIVNELGLNKIDEIKEKRKNSGVKEKEDAELKEIIDTIYSKKLREEIDKAEEEKKKNSEEKTSEEEGELFSELLPSSNEETLINEDLGKEIEKQDKNKKIENSFFTSSMDLSLEDLTEEMEEIDNDISFLDEERKLPIWSVILIILGVLVTVGGLIYYLSSSFM